MNLRIFVCSSLLISTASAAGVSVSYPSLVVDLEGKQSSNGPFQTLNPNLSWSLGVESLGASLKAGIQSSIRPTLDVLSLPQSIYTRLSRPFGNWNADVTASFGLQDTAAAAADDDTDISTHLSNDALDLDLSYDRNTITLSKGFLLVREKNNQRIQLQPSYNLHTSTPSVLLAYNEEDDNLVAQLEANPQEQKLTLSSRIGNSSHTLTPSITSRGKFALGWRKETEKGAITTTLNLKENLECKWEDGDWTCTIDAPFDGWIKTDGINVKVKRRIAFV
jgi:hypothetical protein